MFWVSLDLPGHKAQVVVYLYFSVDQLQSFLLFVVLLKTDSFVVNRSTQHIQIQFMLPPRAFFLVKNNGAPDLRVI